MNGRDYIITGSCEENVVRVCCARTGRRLRDVTLEVSLAHHAPQHNMETGELAMSVLACWIVLLLPISLIGSALVG